MINSFSKDKKFLKEKLKTLTSDLKEKETNLQEVSNKYETL